MSYVEHCKKHGQYHGELCGECFEDLEIENARLREALAFYADTEKKLDCFLRFDEDFVYLDKSDIENIPFKHGDQYGFVPHYGKRARAALEGK